MRTTTGNLIALGKEGHFDVIAHGCNCFHTFGAGLAAQIKRYFPEAYAADLATAYGDPAKLGTCSTAEIANGEHRLTVINAYTQFGFETDRIQVDYAAVRTCMSWIGKTYRGRRIGLPQIGAGLGGGDWPTIERIIAGALAGQDVYIVEYKGR